MSADRIAAAARKLAEFDPVVARAIAVRDCPPVSPAPAEPAPPRRVVVRRRSSGPRMDRKLTILTVLARGPLHAPEIAARSGADLSLVSVHLCQLANKGLAERGGPKLGPSYRWRLTDLGRALLAGSEEENSRPPLQAPPERDLPRRVDLLR